MKQMLVAVTMIGLTCGLTARADDADSLVWCGLDYSKVKMIGTMDFREPDQIFPAMLDAWNNLYMQEMIPLMEKERVAPTIKSDVKAVTEFFENAKQRRDLWTGQGTSPSTGCWLWAREPSSAAAAV